MKKNNDIKAHKIRRKSSDDIFRNDLDVSVSEDSDDSFISTPERSYTIDSELIEIKIDEDVNYKTVKLPKEFYGIKPLKSKKDRKKDTIVEISSSQWTIFTNFFYIKSKRDKQMNIKYLIPYMKYVNLSEPAKDLFILNTVKYSKTFSKINEIGWFKLNEVVRFGIESDLKTMINNIETVWASFKFSLTFEDESEFRRQLVAQDKASLLASARCVYKMIFRDIDRDQYRIVNYGNRIQEITTTVIKEIVLVIIALIIDSSNEFDEANRIIAIIIITFLLVFQVTFWVRDFQNGDEMMDEYYIKILIIHSYHITTASKIYSCLVPFSYIENDGRTLGKPRICKNLSLKVTQKDNYSIQSK